MPRLNWSLTIPTVISKSWNVVSDADALDPGAGSRAFGQKRGHGPVGVLGEPGRPVAGETTTLEIGSRELIATTLWGLGRLVKA